MTGIIVEHEGFYAFARFYPDDGYYHGLVENIDAHATFGGETPEEVMQDFREMIDGYLETNGEKSMPESEKQFEKK